MGLYVIGKFEGDKLVDFFRSGRNCNVGCYTNISGAKRALAHVNSYRGFSHDEYKIIELLTFTIIEA